MKRIFAMILLICSINLTGCSLSVNTNNESSSISEINSLYVELNTLKKDLEPCDSFENIKKVLSAEKEFFDHFSTIDINYETESGKCIEKIRTSQPYKLFESDYVTLKNLENMVDGT